MKRILITGANSFIGTYFANYLCNNFSSDYIVETIDMIDGTWKLKNFSKYDSVYHVAGIAHSDNGKISDEKIQLYRRVNTDLAIETAKKAKKEGVKQFILMSSAIVYGESAPIGKNKIITRNTDPSPSNFYGESKLQAELGIIPLQDEDFHICILRPPMIYGKGCKGNFPILEKFATRLFVFPNIKNSRSMLYIGNLVEFVRLLIENNENGLFWPQNADYSNTSELVKMIATTKGKKIFLLKGFTWAFKILSHLIGVVNKAFGNFCYEQSMSEYKQEYRLFSLLDSIIETERDG